MFNKVIALLIIAGLLVTSLTGCPSPTTTLEPESPAKETPALEEPLPQVQPELLPVSPPVPKSEPLPVPPPEPKSEPLPVPPSEPKPEPKPEPEEPSPKPESEKEPEEIAPKPESEAEQKLELQEILTLPDGLKEIPRITVDDLYQKLDDNTDILIVDNRGIDAYIAGHIQGAISVPLSRIETGQWQAPEGKQFILY